MSFERCPTKTKPSQTLALNQRRIRQKETIHSAQKTKTTPQTTNQTCRREIETLPVQLRRRVHRRIKVMCPTLQIWHHVQTSPSLSNRISMFLRLSVYLWRFRLWEIFRSSEVFHQETTMGNPQYLRYLWKYSEKNDLAVFAHTMTTYKGYSYIFGGIRMDTPTN